MEHSKFSMANQHHSRDGESHASLSESRHGKTGVQGFRLGQYNPGCTVTEDG